MSWLFLALSVGFFFMQDFRWGLAFPLLQVQSQETNLSAIAAIGPSELRALGDRARAAGDADGLAFAALYSPSTDAADAMSLADAAVIKDPAKGWLYCHVAQRYLEENHDGPAVDEMAKKAADYDPDNAMTHLLAAAIVRARTKDWPMFAKEKDRYPTEKLAGQKEWLAAMERTYAAGRYDNYGVARFLMERKVLQKEGWAQPGILLRMMVNYPLPSLFNVRQYANYKLQVAADRNAKGSHDAELVHDGYEVYRFGHLMENGAATIIEEMIGRAVQNIAYQPLHDALRRQKNEDAVVALNLDHQRAQIMNSEFRHVLNQRSNSLWSGMVLMVCAALTVVFALCTLLCLAYVNAKRWIRPDKQGRIFHAVTMAENYVPILLFLSAYTLFMFYVPYASNFRAYMAAEGEMRSLQPLYENVYPLIGADPYGATPIHPFGGYLYWVIVCFLAVGGAILMRRFYASDERLEETPETKGAAAGE